MPASQDQTFFEHLDEFRMRLLISIIAVCAASIFAYFFSDQILFFVTQPIARYVDRFYFFSPIDAFSIRIKLSLLCGVIIAFPVLMTEFWLFVSPAFRETEKKALLPLILVTSGLFLTGVLVAFYVVMPKALEFLIGMQSAMLQPMISAHEYFSFLTGMLLAFGVAFNLPVFLLALVALKILRARTLNHFQKHAILLIFIAAAILTPGPDIASQLILAVPMVILFEISVVIANLIDKQK